MKSRYILILFVVFLATPLWMRIGWEFSPKRELNLLIVDKTVLNSNSFKHRSINWILDYEKYIKKGGSYYDINKDYFGFFPGEDDKYSIQDFEKLDDGEVDSLSKNYDMAYFADTYGVMGNEWYSHRDRNDNSESIYGGLTEKDLLLMKKMKARQKPVIAEFNTIGYPTPKDMRVEFEKLWGVKWSGWMTRYIASLDTVNNPDLPKWIIRAYKKEHGGVWNFKNEGMLFIHESGKVLVLESGNQLNEGIPKIYTEKKFQNMYGVPAVMIYPFWIDIMENKNDTNELISKYVIGTNPSGEQMLADNGIPKIFPAIIHHEKDYNFYYFCGDFADNPTKFRFAKLYGVTALKFLMYNAVDKTDRNRFFWEFYLPMMQTVFSNTYLNRLQRK